MIASLLKQLLCQLDGLPWDVGTAYETSLRCASSPSFDSLVTLFTSVSKQFTIVYVLIDAIDECHSEYQEDVIALIHQLSESSIKVMCTSRDHLEMHDSASLTVKAKPTDIRKYITSKLRKERQIGEALRERIVEQLTLQAEGMYPNI